MINVEQDGTLSTFLQIDEVAPNLPALRERERLRNEWHYIPEVLTKQWKDAVKVKKSFFSLELYNEGISIGAHLFIVAKILVAHWICKSIESGEHETLTSADHNEILHFQMTETVKLSYLWEHKANALDCIKKVDAKLFLPAIVKAGGFTDVNSVRGVGRKAESIADQYIKDYRSGKCPANAKPCQCGELWAAIMPAYNFEHWKAFMNDATCDLLPTEAICADSLEDEKQMLVAAAMTEERGRRQRECMALLKENIPISTAYFRRLIQLRARYCIDALTFVTDNEEIHEVKAELVQNHQRVLDENN